MLFTYQPYDFVYELNMHCMFVYQLDRIFGAFLCCKLLTLLCLCRGVILTFLLARFFTDVPEIARYDDPVFSLLTPASDQTMVPDDAPRSHLQALSQPVSATVDCICGSGGDG